MAMITYPLNNIDYSAADAGLFHCTRKSGIWAEDSFPIYVSNSDNSITIGSGIAWISNDKYWGKVVAQKEAVTLDLGLADSVYNRIDAVVIQFDSNSNATDIVVKKGTPATRPSMPEIVQNKSTFELCLCKVLRPAGSSVVAFANITDTRLDPTVCGLMADSVTKIDTDAINAQVQELILSLIEEIEGVRDNTEVLLKKGLYPVGAIFMTATPNSPAEYLGGTWECFDKQLAFESYNTEEGADFWSPTSNIKKADSSVYAAVEGHMVNFRFNIATNVNIGDEDVILGHVNYAKLGFDSVPYSAIYEHGTADAGESIVSFRLDYETGELKTVDINPKADGQIVPSGSLIHVLMALPIASTAMIDKYCNKFYWKRIA